MSLLESKSLRLALVILGCVGGLSASPTHPDDAVRQLKLTRFLHHGESESMELQCTASVGCRLLRRRNGTVVSDVSIPRGSADAILSSFFQLVPPRTQRRIAGQREMLLHWHVRWLGHELEGRLDREERNLDEPFIDAVLSLEGALLSQLYALTR